MDRKQDNRDGQTRLFDALESRTLMSGVGLVDAVDHGSTDADAGQAAVVESLGEDLANTETSSSGGIRVATGDVNDDGTPDIITAPGAGGGPHIKVFDAQSSAHEPAFLGGVRVAAGDVNNDGLDDIVVGPGPGSAPNPEPFVFYPAFTGGVRVATGDVNGDGAELLIVNNGDGSESDTDAAQLPSTRATDIALRAADYKTEQARQVTIVQDL